MGHESVGEMGDNWVPVPMTRYYFRPYNISRHLSFVLLQGKAFQRIHCS